MSNLSAATDHDDRDVFNIKEEAVLKTEGKGEEMFPPKKSSFGRETKQQQSS